MIKINCISKAFEHADGISSLILKDISFVINDNKIYSLVGPSGAGKTLLLKIICGFNQADSGRIEKDSKNKILYIPSAPSTFPWLSVEENILFGLDKNNFGNIRELIKLVELDGYEKHYPHNASIGFRFRISLARTLANNPSLICIDDSFNDLNEISKFELILLLRKISKIKKIPILLAATNVIDSILLSDVVFLMSKNPGEIVKTYQIDLPVERSKEIITENRFLDLKEIIEKDLNSIQFLQK